MVLEYRRLIFVFPMVIYYWKMAHKRLYHRRRFHVPWRSGGSFLYFQ